MFFSLYCTYVNQCSEHMYGKGLVQNVLKINYKIYVFAAILALPLPGGCRHMGKGLPRTVTSQSTANHLFELPCPSTAFSQANFGGPPCVILAEKSLDIFSQLDGEGINLMLFYYATTGPCSPFRGSSVSPPQEFD